MRAIRARSVPNIVCTLTFIRLVAACAAPSAPRPIANLRGPLPPPTVTCFAGTFTEDDGEQRKIVMRRTVDPLASTIRQEAVRSSGGFGFVARGQVALAITGSTFRTETPEHAHGQGRLDGPSWAWTHWTETRHHRPDPHPLTEEIEGWLDTEHLRFRGRYTEKAATWSAELGLLDCALYDARIDAMTGLDDSQDR